MPLSPYGGFRLTGKQGNNAFAYDERKRTDPDPKLRVPSLKEISSIDDIALGDQSVFTELDDTGAIVTYTGLKHLYRLPPGEATTRSPDEIGRGSKGGLKNERSEIIVIDNHNHALYFRSKHIFSLPHFNDFTVLHIDQHSDLSQSSTPVPPFVKGVAKPGDLETRSHYTNHTCNVGNFIQPALEVGLISQCIRIKNQYDLDTLSVTFLSKECLPGQGEMSEGQRGFVPYILDIDLDFRAPEMGTDLATSKPLLTELMRHASLVTIATSPYFLDQQRALDLLHDLFT